MCGVAISAPFKLCCSLVQFPCSYNIRLLEIFVLRSDALFNRTVAHHPIAVPVVHKFRLLTAHHVLSMSLTRASAARKGQVAFDNSVRSHPGIDHPKRRTTWHALRACML